MKAIFTFHLILTLLVLSASSLLSADKQTLTAAEIISKHLQAVGGKGALAKFHSRIAIGTVKKDDEPETKMAIMSELPNRVSAIFVFSKYDWQLTYDGTKAFIRPLLPRDFSPIQDKYQEMLASGLMFNSISLYNALLEDEGSGTKFEAKGMKTIKGRPTYVVDIKRPRGRSARLYFDAETFMWVRTDYGRAQVSKPMGQFTNDIVPHGEDELSVDFYFETSDFRDVDGVKLPFRYEQSVTSPIIKQKKVGTISGTITEYRHNVPIDPKMFE